MERRHFLGLTSKAIVLSSIVPMAPGVQAQGRFGGPPVRLGLAGYGMRGARLAALARAVNGVQITGVADAYQGRLERAKEVLGASLFTARDARALLDRPDVDAVLIATPDHLHAPIAAAAAAAGKDVYCEGPAAHTPADLAALEKTFGAPGMKGARIFQGGAGIATSPLFVAAKKLIADGRIGKVTMAAGTWDSGSAFDAWVLSYPPDASAASIDFAAFNGAQAGVAAGGAAPAFDAARFFRWPCYWQYGSGLAGMRAAPQLAALHWMLGLTAPTRVSTGGGTLRWKDSREVPDTLTATLDYASGMSVMLSMSQNGTGRPRELRIIGTQGTLVIGDDEMVLAPEPEFEPYDRIGDTYAKPSRDWFYMIHGLANDGRMRGAAVPALEKRAERYVLPENAGVNVAHLSAFADAVRTREAGIEPLAGALDVARATQMIALSSRRGACVTPADLTKDTK